MVNRTIFVLFLVFTFCLSSLDVFAATKPARKVILISWDGFGANVFRVSQPENLLKLQKAGIYSLKARTIFPSLTLPSHTSMLSGVGPEKHRVDWNVWDPLKGQIQVPTIFDLLRKNEKKIAFIAGKEKFQHFKAKIPEGSFYLGKNVEEVSKFADDVIRKQDVDFIFIHFPDPDVAGHSFGWLSAEQLAAVKVCDEALGKMLKALKETGSLSRTTILLSADHGGHLKTHGTQSDEDSEIPWILSGNIGRKPEELEESIRTFDTAATIASLFAIAVPKEWKWDGKPVSFK